MTETAAGSLESPGERRADRWGPLLVLGLARLAVSWAASETGLLALSDDDYARVVIAQSFASQPKLDPSGTSWLPFPFWVTGTVMKVLDPSLGVARAASSALAIGATWLVFAAGRMWGFTDRQALVGALGATALPVVMVLGSVTVPELPTAALCAFALVAVSASSVAAGPSALAGPSTPPSAKRRAWSPALLAGTAMLAATLSRYEAWPIAVVVSTFAFLGKDEPVLWKRILSVALPLVGPAGWILHNRLVHGDALVFLHRVSSYRAALGQGASMRETLGYLGGVVGGCPAVVIALAGLAFVSFFQEGRAAATQRLRRFRPWAIGAAALLAFLTVGELVGGAPTHHPERALLCVWLLATLAVVDLARSFKAPRWLVILTVALLALDYRGTLSDHGVDRRSEETIGIQLRSLVPRGQRVIVATNDYGYFAVIAAFGRPSDAIIDDNHDPRTKHEKSLIDDRWIAPERLKAQNAQWLVAPSTVVFPMALRERTRDSLLAIYELETAR